MSKHLSLATAINYILNFDDYRGQYDDYELLYQLALLTQNHKAAAKYYKALHALVPGEPAPLDTKGDLNSFLVQLVFPTQFIDRWDDCSPWMRSLIDKAIELGNKSAVNAKAVALGNHCPCTGQGPGTNNPDSEEDMNNLKRFIDFASKHASDLSEEVTWMAKYATGKNRDEAPEMDFFVTNLLKDTLENPYATDKEWTEYCDMVRFERSYANRAKALENVHKSALHKYIAAHVLYSKRSVVTFSSQDGGSNGYSIEKDVRIDKETGLRLFDMAAAEGCHNARWERE